MFIYTVGAGDTLFSLAQSFSIPQALLAEWNGISAPYDLAVGQALLVLSPGEIRIAQNGETAAEIAGSAGIALRELYRLNPGLCGGACPLRAGDPVLLSTAEEQIGDFTVNAYAYTFISEDILRGTLPYLSSLAPFTYGFTENGELLSPDDFRLISAAEEYGVSPLMHLSTLTEEGNFSSQLASDLFASPEAEARLINELTDMVIEKNYAGLDIDFEFIPREDAENYASFIAQARRRLAEYSRPVYAALAPKTSADQPGTLYEGHDYALIGDAADKVFLMTYEWGYTYGPPMAVAPIGSVRRVLEYAVSEIPRDKIIMGIPNYGYDWTLPYKSGETRARSISNVEAVGLAARYGAEIRFDENAQSPYFYYENEYGMHEVWFEDVRSIEAKLALAYEFGFSGVGYWNAMRPFPQNWLYLTQKYNTRPSI